MEARPISSPRLGGEDDSDGVRAHAVPLAAGEQIDGKYRLQALLGRGSMAEVWRARHEELGVDVAIKFSTEGASSTLAEEVLRRFRFEARVSAQLAAQTDRIVAVHDVGRHAGVPFMVMEFVRGPTLETLMAEQGPLPPAMVATIVEQAAAALSVAHQHGILHRDVKPSNVMVERRADGESTVGLHVKLADFGVAKLVSPSLEVAEVGATGHGRIVGTPAYLSPEAIAGDRVGEGTDQWALAVLAYEALTGQLPFGADAIADLLLAICTRPHEPPRVHLPSLPTGVDALFRQALAKQSAKRFESATEMAGALRAALTPAGLGVVRRRASVLMGLLLLGALGAVAVPGLFPRRSQQLQPGLLRPRLPWPVQHPGLTASSTARVLTPLPAADAADQPSTAPTRRTTAAASSAPGAQPAPATRSSRNRPSTPLPASQDSGTPRYPSREIDPSEIQ